MSNQEKQTAQNQLLNDINTPVYERFKQREALKINKYPRQQDLQDKLQAQMNAAGGLYGKR